MIAVIPEKFLEGKIRISTATTRRDQWRDLADRCKIFTRELFQLFKKRVSEWIVLSYELINRGVCSFEDEIRDHRSQHRDRY